MTQPSAIPRRVLVVAGLVIAVLLALLWISRPRQVSHFVVDRIGQALGLEISASGTSSYRLRGTPQLVLHDVIVRQPGERPLLRARRIAVSLPWSTLRTRGADLTIDRIALDAPELDLPALRRWQATRPPSTQRLPTLTGGLQVREGQVIGDGWEVRGLALRLPLLQTGRPVRAHASGTLSAALADGKARIPFDLGVALTRPDRDAGLGLAGTVELRWPTWRAPLWLTLSGPLHLGNGTPRLTPLQLGAAGRLHTASNDLPVALGLHGALRLADGTWSLAPAGVALRGTGPLPQLHAAGRLAYGQALAVRLRGALATWPDAWPALPPPIGQSSAPLPFTLDYTGAASLGDALSLRLARDDAWVNARLRLPEVLAWIDAPPGNPLPPLQAHAGAARLDVAGAQLEGVEVRIDDGDADAGQPLAGGSR